MGPRRTNRRVTGPYPSRRGRCRGAVVEKEPAWAVTGIVLAVMVLLLGVAVRQEARLVSEDDRRAVPESLSRLVSTGSLGLQPRPRTTCVVADTAIARLATTADSWGRAGEMHDQWLADLRHYLRDTPALGEEHENRFNAQVNLPSPNTPPISVEQYEFTEALGPRPAGAPAFVHRGVPLRAVLRSRHWCVPVRTFPT